ncbi:hypothetical protein BDR22DRAFT_838145 [Usnea florida]
MSLGKGQVDFEFWGEGVDVLFSLVFSLVFSPVFSPVFPFLFSFPISLLIFLAILLIYFYGSLSFHTRSLGNRSLKNVCPSTVPNPGSGFLDFLISSIYIFTRYYLLSPIA